MKYWPLLAHPLLFVGLTWCSPEAPPTLLVCRCGLSGATWHRGVEKMTTKVRRVLVISLLPFWVSSCWGPMCRSHPPQCPCPKLNQWKLSHVAIWKQSILAPRWIFVIFGSEVKWPVHMWERYPPCRPGLALWYWGFLVSPSIGLTGWEWQWQPCEQLQHRGYSRTRWRWKRNCFWCILRTGCGSGMRLWENV